MSVFLNVNVVVVIIIVIISEFISCPCFVFYLNQHFVSKVSYLVTNLNSDHEKVKLQRPLVAYFNVTLYLFI